MASTFVQFSAGFFNQRSLRLNEGFEDLKAMKGACFWRYVLRFGVFWWSFVESYINYFHSNMDGYRIYVGRVN